MTLRLAGLALAGLAGLAVLADAAAPEVAVADAALWEGQEVRLRGIARDVRPTEGGARFDLVADGHAIAVRLDGDGPPAGAAVEATGRVGRSGGTLTLFASRVAPVGLDPGARVALPALAHDAAHWLGRVANVTGTVERGHLEADGHRIALGDGDWPKAGPVEADVLLRYDAKCACHRLDRVGQWTS